MEAYRLMRNSLKALNSFGIAMLRFSPLMKAASREGILISDPMIGSTVSLNFAGCAVSQKTPVSLSLSRSFSA